MKLGITGHQRLADTAAWEWVAEIFDRELGTCLRPLFGITSLAIGADQLFAQRVIAHGGSLIHIKPFADYERTFDGESLSIYLKLAAQAAIEVLDFQGTDEDSYLAAGHRMVEQSTRLLAVWNGLPARGKGGTADIVQYALAAGKEVLHLNPVSREVTKLH